MSKKLYFLISFVLVLSLGGLAQAVSVEVPNFSFELDKNGNQLTEGWYADVTVLMAWTPDDLWGGTSGVTSKYSDGSAYEGDYSVMAENYGGSLYQILDHTIIADKRYTLNFDAAKWGETAWAGLEVFASLFYDAGGGSYVDIVSQTYPTPPQPSSDLWWYPHLTLSFVSQAGQAYLGNNLGIEIGFPDDEMRWSLMDNVRLDVSPLELAWNPNPSDAAVNVGVDVNEDSPRYMKLVVGYTDWFDRWKESGTVFVGGEWTDANEAKLTWGPGDYANSHNVYFSTNFDEVNDACDSVLTVESDCNHDPGPLEHRQKYYWRVDEVNTTTVTTWPGEVWSFTVRKPPNKVHTWDNDQGNNLWSEPNNWEPNTLPTLNDTAIVTDPLNYCTVDAAKDANCLFLVVGDGDFVGNVDVNIIAGADLTVYSDIRIGTVDVNDLNGTSTVTMTGGGVDVGRNLLVGDGADGTLTITSGTINVGDDLVVPNQETCTGIVNLNGGIINAGGFGGYKNIGTVDITAGTLVLDGNESTLNLVGAPPSTGWIYSVIRAYGGRGHVVVDYNDVNDKTTLTAVQDLNIAWNPRPASGAANVAMDATLSWSPGDGASGAGKHRLYLSTDFDDVNDRIVDVLTALDTNSYPAFLDLGEQYFWCVDETDGTTTWPGHIWTFTTAEYSVVDDFDSYADNAAIRAVWKDYWSDPSGNNDAEVKVFSGGTDANLVRDGNSMLFAYRNYKTYDGNYVGSEAEASIADLAIGSNWTASGVKALVLYFYGDAGNGQDHAYPISVDQMYVALEDGGSNVGIVKYDKKHNYDMNDIRDASWHDWNIDLADPCLAGVNMANIAKVYIGFGGQKTGQSEAGAGDLSLKHDTVWFDDIRVYPPRCVPALAYLTGSFDGDCDIDYSDLAAISRDWLMSGYGITATEPSSTGLVGHWPMDDADPGGPDSMEVLDISGNGNLGTFHDDNLDPGQTTKAHSTTGIINLALTFDGVDDYVEIPALNLNSNTVTMSAWIKRDGEQIIYAGIVYSRDGSTTAGLSFGSVGAPDWEVNHELSYNWNDAENTWAWHSGLIVPNKLWTFVAVTVEPTKATLYMRPSYGTLCAARNYVNHDIEEFDGLSFIGSDHPNWARNFKGTIDDIHIYNRALSPGEILYMAQQGPGSQYLELESWRADADDDDKVDFKDYAIMADNWLKEPVLWPEP